MRIKIVGGVGSPVLEKSEVSRLLDAVYIGRRLAPEITGKMELLDALLVIETAARKFGAKHLDAAGRLKVSPRAKRDEPEAPIGGA
jgi:hypothetical protein